MQRYLIYVLINACLVLPGCSSLHKATGNKLPATISELRFINEYDVPYNTIFKATTIGGLSGIDYDAKRQLYYMICDDRSDINPARFYKARLHIGAKGIDSVEFVDVVTLLQQDGNAYPNSKQDPAHTPDPEALRYNPRRDEVVWSSEGERIVQKDKLVLEDPSIIAITRGGNYKDTFVLPPQMHIHTDEHGPRRNGVFEGLAFDDNFRRLFVSVEEPIYEDGPRAGLYDSTGWIRIIKYDVATRKPIAQYAYQIEPVAYPETPAGSFRINGVADILSAGQNKLIITERSFSTGKLNCTIRVYIADVSMASDISAIASLKSAPATHPISKRLLLNMDALGRYIDNIEGVTFGPVLPNGHHTLIFIADNNFSKDEVTQFLLYEVMP